LVACPRCGSDNIERTGGIGTTTVALFGASGIALLIGLFFWPLLIVAGLLFLFTVVMMVLGILGKAASLTNQKSKEHWQKANWQWRCKKCGHIFTHVLESPPVK